MNPLIWLVFPFVWLQGDPVVLVVGNGGTQEYADQFAAWAEDYAQASIAGRHPVLRVEVSENQKQRLLDVLSSLPANESTTVWVVLVGHGTFDGRTAKFNLVGPDLTPADLNSAMEGRPNEWVILQTATASGGFLKPLAGPRRVLVAATRSGDELSFARFGGSLAQAFLDPQADIDQDEQVSLLEAFLSSGLKVQSFYEDEGRLVTEHALLDDNGDGKGTPGNWYEGLRLVKRSADGTAADGFRAKQLHLVPSLWESRWPPSLKEKRDALEQELQILKDRKASLDETEYQKELERLISELAELYRAVRDQDSTDEPTAADDSGMPQDAPK